ncbi:MAG: cyanophycin synthetase, partial [Ilumatobacteraceae bacterium]
HRSFAHAGADYAVRDGWLAGPSGRIAAVASMRRRLPHDLTNALAGAAAVLETGLVDTPDVAATLESFTGPPHRISEVAMVDGVRYVDDSKATTPHAASVAVRAFEPVVLIAGGRSKGLDLAPLAVHHDRIRAVVAIGEAADEVRRAFVGCCPVHAATSMDDAVATAAALAHAGDTVLLSPGFASWDWYPVGGYAARGDAFAGAVRERAQRAGRGSGRGAGEVTP